MTEPRTTLHDRGLAQALTEAVMARTRKAARWVVVGQSQNGEILFAVGPFETSEKADAWAKQHLTSPAEGSGLRYYITDLRSPDSSP